MQFMTPRKDRPNHSFMLLSSVTKDGIPSPASIYLLQSLVSLASLAGREGEHLQTLFENQSSAVSFKSWTRRHTCNYTALAFRFEGGRLYKASGFAF